MYIVGVCLECILGGSSEDPGWGGGGASMDHACIGDKYRMGGGCGHQAVCKTLVQDLDATFALGEASGENDL